MGPRRLAEPFDAPKPKNQASPSLLHYRVSALPASGYSELLPSALRPSLPPAFYSHQRSGPSGYSLAYRGGQGLGQARRRRRSANPQRPNGAQMARSRLLVCIAGKLSGDHLGACVAKHVAVMARLTDEVAARLPEYRAEVPGPEVLSG